MRWVEVMVYTTEQAVESIADFLREQGAGGVAIEESGALTRKRDTSLGQWYELPLNDIPEGDAEIKGYFAEPTDVDEIVKQLSAYVSKLGEFGIDAGRGEISYKVVREEDWANAWKQYFKPLRISDKITVKPTWEPYTAEPGELIIELDPGMAFGTGTHPTTGLCLQALEKVIRGGETIIDIGTGSGILAIGAVKLGAKHVLALDLDPVAVSSAESNVGLNQLDDKITVKQSDLLSVVLANSEHQIVDPVNLPKQGRVVDLPADIVVANILAEIVILVTDDVRSALAKGGYYIASGIIKTKEDDVEKALVQAGFTITERLAEEDWVAFIARKL